MKFFKKYIFLFFVFSCNVSAINFTPIVGQFNKKDYKAGNQNWSVAQDSKGMLYFGNNDGLLRFDGSNFTLIKLPNEQIVRSVYIDKNDRIYIGSFKEFGYFEKNKLGILIYTSLLTKLINFNMGNDEIWKILEFDGKIIFQSFKSVFTYNLKSVEGYTCNQTFLFIHEFNNQLYATTLQDGFCRFDLKKKVFEPLQDVPFKSAVIALVSNTDKHAHVVTQSDGVFTFDGKRFSKKSKPELDFINSVGVNRATITRDSIIIIGTILDGVTAMDANGNFLWKLNTANNLQNNTVLGMLRDADNNVWLALDKGVAVIRLNKPVRFAQSFSPAIGSIYSLYQQSPNLLYIATNQGLYSAEFSEEEGSLNKLKLDPTIKGQVWDLTKIDDQLICGNNEETYQIQPTRQILSYSKGGMCIRKGMIHDKEVLVQGTYSDICIYIKENGIWKFHSNINGFLNPIRYVEIDYQGRIWAAHMNQGLYMIKLKNDLKTIDKLEEFKSLNNMGVATIGVFEINKRIVFSDRKKFYIYDDIVHKIVPFDELNNSLGKYQKAYRVCYQRKNGYWFVLDNEAALFDFSESAIQLKNKLQFSFFENQTVDKYQNIIPTDDDTALFTLENGLALLNLDQGVRGNKSFKRDIQIMEVQTIDKFSEEKMLLPIDSELDKIAFSYKKNRIRFTVSYPDYTELNNLSFSYRLTGLNDKWSENTPNNIKEYSYLVPGDYSFSVRVLNGSGEVLAVKKYSFTVSPPFYWNAFSKMFYLLLLICIVYLTLRLIKKKHDEKRNRFLQNIERQRIKEIEKREQQIIALKAQSLENDLNQKSKELAVSTMTIINKNEILSSVKNEIVALKKLLSSQFPNKYYEKLIRMVDESMSSEEDWAVFQTNFDRIHENFFRNLHQRYPKLTSNDLRFCAYFRLNLPTKDIAQLMNISTKGVEMARYRIRKKIDIASDKSLSEFFVEFK